MKKVYSLLMASAIALTANSQLVFNENFTGYTNGDLGTQGGWVNFGGTPDVQIANANPLTYTGYTSGLQYAVVSSNNGTDPRKAFSIPINTSGTQSIYVSFLIRVTAAPEGNQNPQASITLENTANTNYPVQFYVREDQGSSTDIEFGIAVGSTAPVYTSGDYQYNTTYLIVIRYDVIAGAGNDDAYLWVNPALAAEPSTAIATGATGAQQLNVGEVAYGTELNALRIWQTDATGSVDAAYDGIRVAAGTNAAAAWSNLAPVGAPMPVRLTSFNASAEGFNTKLVWNTAEEIGISEYIVEKSTDGRSYKAIGTVKAANLKSYSFIDGQSADNSYYRLKMVELDGTYKYSYIVSVKAKLDASLLLSPNPVKSSLMIQHPKANATSHIQIMSANGQLLRDIRLSANAVISNIDMSGLTSGLYHVVYRSGSDMFSKTVLKQ